MSPEALDSNKVRDPQFKANVLEQFLADRNHLAIARY